MNIDDLISTLDESSGNSLEHYGVLGMKWGVRKDRDTSDRAKERRRKKQAKVLKKARARKKKLAEARKKEAEKAKIERDKILRSPRLLKKYQYNFSQEEVNDAIRRFDNDTRLRNVQVSKIESGRRFVESLAGMTRSGVNIYNTAASAYNTFNKGSSKLPTINTGDNKKKKKNKDSDDDDD